MNAARRLVAGFALALSFVAGTATAMPPILDRVPADAALIVAVPNVEQLETNVKAVADLIGMPLPVGVEALLMQVGITNGFNKAGSMVLVMASIPDEEAMGPPDMLLLIPTSNYENLLKSYNLKPSGGIDEITMPKGDDKGYVKALSDGYAVMGPVKASVEKFSGQAGNAEVLRKLIGKAGTALADRGDAFVVLNVEKARPFMKKIFEEGLQRATDQMAMFGGGDETAFNLDAPKFIANTLMAETQAIVAGISMDNMGVALELGANFQPGSRLAKIASGTGKAAALLARLPSQPYLLAAAGDFSSPDLKAFVKDIPRPKAVTGMEGINVAGAIDRNDGASVVIGVPPGGLMGGLFTRTVTFKATSDPEGAVQALQATLDAMKKADLAEVKFTPDAETIEGTKVSTWEMKLRTDGNPQMGQAMGLFFGPSGGPSGYIAPVKGGFIQTYSKNKDLAGKALKAAGGGDTLSGEKLIDQISKKLPDGRMAEAYLGVKTIIESTLPMVSMFTGMQVKYDLPPSLPPVALAVTPAEGGAIVTVYVPNQTIKTAAGVAKAFKDAANRGEGGDEEKDVPGKKPEKKPGF